MKTENYIFPTSSFLSVEKDMKIISEMILKNQRIKKLLYYTTKDALDRPNLTQDESLDLFGKNIRMVPKMYVDEDVRTYIIIHFNNFVQSENPEFRDNIIEFDIICHFDQWQLKDFQLRPYRIAAEIDTIFNHQRLTGIGEIEFFGATQILMTNEFSGICLMYQATHGIEDKKFPVNPVEGKSQAENFDEMFNNKN